MYTIVFGWGKKSKHWKAPDGKVLVATWDYFSILWCPISFNLRWHLIEDEKIEVHTIVGDRIISHDKVREIFPKETPDVDAWQRYGLALVIIGIAIINIWF